MNNLKIYLTIILLCIASILYISWTEKRDQQILDTNYCTTSQGKHYQCDDEEFEMNKLLVIN